MKNLVADGRVLTVTATADIKSGDLVKIGDVVGVASCDAATGEPVSVRMHGVYTAPKAAGFSAAQGSKLYLEAATGNLVATATGNTYAGYAYDAAASADTVVNVRLVG